ncbi:prepilin-type N-terminal cleavage/methylation domain-containing protein [Acinetobacter sp. ANC 4633]|uniref:pilus assembly FimT family protein n=1 Tax=Acinetobacter sp. ANC 4633 TaxID=2529845 RepID=UPI00103B0198|nr:GspH/FimT family pseudopilin [Acinetobacter sp. ANC 4633]TCB25220.1 prepilin-type N-terminal cleavage/methylation domain-containing protein [Acinetobacter sp. ANC 4633]
MQSIRGFTLFELIVVVIIIAIISVMAVPAFANILLKQNLNKSTRDLVIVLEKARSKAALERRTVTVTLNSSSADTDSTLNWAASGKAALVSTTTSIVFRSDGMVQDPITTTDLTLVLCDQTQAQAQYSKRIILSHIGIVQQRDLVTGNCNAN